MDLQHHKIALVHELLEVENPDVLNEIEKILERNRKKNKTEINITAKEWSEIEADTLAMENGSEKRIPARKAAARLRKLVQAK